MTPRADVVLSVHNGAPYLEDQVRSIQSQTEESWRLWIRDDGSIDGSRDVADSLAKGDPRIHVHPADGTCMGSGPAFGWLLERIPDLAPYVFCSDADDVWLPEKMHRSLDAMARAETEAPGPVMVHTDLAVVDAELAPVAPSLWAYRGLDPQALALPLLAVANVVTGPTILMNRPLVGRVLPIPAESYHQDWWMALVAAAVGRVVAVPEATVLYRRHETNTTGALRGEGTPLWRVIVAATAPGRSREIRRWVEGTGRQAAALVQRLRGELSPQDVTALEEIASTPGCTLPTRKLRILRRHLLRSRGVVRNLEILLRG